VYLLAQLGLLVCLENIIEHAFQPNHGLMRAIILCILCATSLCVPVWLVYVVSVTSSRVTIPRTLPLVPTVEYTSKTVPVLPISVIQPPIVHQPDSYHWAQPPILTLDDHNVNVNPDHIAWVWLVHFSGSEARSRVVWATWARRFDPRVAIIAFGTPIPAHVPTSVISLPYTSGAWDKTLYAFQKARRIYPNAEYISKFDDDTYVYSKNLYHRLFDNESPIPYGGYPLHDYGVTWASGGAGYTLHRSVLGKLDECHTAAYPHYEDLSMRLCLSIDPVDLVGAHPHNPWQMLRWDRDGHPKDHVHHNEPDEGYITPLTYHYIDPKTMERMHDDWFVLGAPPYRTRGLPKVIHQFWTGRRRPPAFAIESCRDMHAGWTHHLWNDTYIQANFPNHQLVNHADYTRRVTEINLLSDIFRYEALLQYGGVYIDADTHCLQPLDFLWRDLFTPKSDSNRHDGFCVYESEKYSSNVAGHQLVATGVLAMHPFAPTAILLVKHLSATDWSQPAWVSAGPLYATRLFARLNPPMTYLPSRLFYPYHHRDTRHTQTYDMHAYLQEKGALTDQLWSTTHNAYPAGKSIKTPAELLRTMQGSNPILASAHPLRRILDTYTEFHRRSLSPVHRKRPRWIVVPTEPAAGMCNRIMNLLSALLLAIATERTLLFDWNTIPAQKWYAQQTETIGHSGYDQTFGSPPIMFSYRDVLQYFGVTDTKAGSATIDWRHRDFLVNLRTRDMDQMYPHSVIFVQRFDWWGPLLLANRHYHPLFHTVTASDAFPILLRYLFPLKAVDQQTLDTTPPCSWFVQIRRKWERKTAPLSQFVQCAENNGYTTSDATVSYLASDTSESPLNSGLTPVSTTYCRSGAPDCDRNTLKTMYALSKCTTGAVLTATSTFGACIAGLGRIPKVFRVTDTGQCQRLRNSDPALDVGVLSSEEPVLINVMNTPEAPFTAAFVYLMYQISRETVAELRKSLAQLHTHFNVHHHYPVVLFVDDARHWYWFQAETSARVHIVEISAQDWAIPSGSNGQPVPVPDVFKLRSSPRHQGFSLAYRQMSRYAAGYLLNHAYLERFTYVLKVYPDTHTTGSWSMDPFASMHARRTRFAFWVSYADTSDVTDNLYETFQSYLQVTGLSMKQPDLIVDSQGQYKRTTFYGCFLAAETEFFRRPEYHRLFAYFDQRFGWFLHRWDEQKIYAFYVALYLDATEVEFMNYVNVEHQGWATQPQRGV